MFPKQYKNVAFIARHGSWNREQKFGYDVVMAKISGHKAKIEPFLTGLLNNEKNEFSKEGAKDAAKDGAKDGAKVRAKSATATAKAPQKSKSDAH